MRTDPIHSLLKRQLKRLQLDPAGPPPDSEAWAALLDRVSRAYADADQARYLLERALSISNQEMQSLYDELREKSATDISAVRERADFSAAHLAAVLDTVGEGIVTVTESGRIIHANAELQSICGYTEEELKNREAVEFLAAPHRDAVRKQLREANRTGDNSFFGKRHTLTGLRKSGEVFPLEAKITETRVGAARFYTVAVHDISQRVLAQKGLLAQMRRNEIILQQAVDGFYMQTMQGHFVEVNRSLCAMSGYTHQELMGRTIFDLYDAHPGDLVQLLEEVKQAGEKRFESHLRCAHAERIKVEVTARYAHFEGEEFYSVFVRDLTAAEEAKARESELQVRLARSERMESLGLLAGGVAHDLNNILGPLVAYPDLLEEELSGQTQALAMVNEMGNSARRAAAVIQDLLSLARRGNYQKTSIDLNDVLSQYLSSPDFQERQRSNPEVVIDTELDPTPLPILGSTPHLMQVLMNLVSNSIEAIEGPGTVTIQIRCRYLDVPIGGYDTIEEGDYVVLCISDTGSGISPADLHRIFEPFYTRKMMGRSGTGLGLAVVYGVVKDLHGYIDVTSEVGLGTDFSLYFPVTREEIEEPVEGHTNIRGTERLLVVDDVEGQRQLAMRLLTSLGYPVDTVASGEAAIEYLESHDVDLVVLDMIMEGGMDGLETLTEIRCIRPHQRCIIASGFAETDRVKKSMELGVSEYVLKPYLLEKIGFAVRRELDRAEHSSAAR